jgi:ferric enterobactin receptor
MVRFVSGGLTAVLMCVSAGAAWAQASATPASGDQTALSDVVVEAARPGVVRRIDRTFYDIKDDPQAKAASLIDILGKLPSVSVGADGKVRLLGSGGVTVQFDGKATQGTDVKLNSLTGADVESIEVMTNPSAQVSAQGTGGIINIITRKRQRPGWSGQVTVGAGTDGVDVRMSPSLTLGKWTLGGTAGASKRHSVTRRWEDRTYLDTTGAPLGARAETSRDRQQNDVRNGELKATYRPTDKQSLTLSANTFSFDSDNVARRDVRSAYAGAPSFVETREGAMRMRDRNLDGGYERQGPREGESLKLNAHYETWRWNTTVDFLNAASGADRRFLTRRALSEDTVTLKADYERPFAGKMMLTAGGSWESGSHDVDTGLENVSGPPGLGGSFARSLTSQQDTAAIYATFQFPALGWVVLPGLRYEDVGLDVTIPGVAPRIRDRDLFPSLHVSREVAKGVTAKFSYSRRIQRPEADSYDPRLEYGGSDSAWSGNPNLKPTFTDAYEAKLARTGRSTSLDLTVYNRESHGEVSWVSRLGADGISIGMPANVGSIVRRGGEASVRGPLVGRLKYVATANLYQREGELLESGVLRRQSEFSYEGSLQLDYKTAAPTNGQAQQFQLVLKASGPSQSLQTRSSGYYRADFTWRRPVTKKVSGVLTVSDIFKTQKFRSRDWGEGYADLSESRNSAPRMRLSLTYQIGGKP